MNLRQTPRKTYVVDKYRNHNEILYTHVIFRVKLHNEDLYAFDLSGAQYGYLETVVPWAHYERTRLSNATNNIVTIKPFDGFRTSLYACIQGSSLRDVIMRYNVTLSEETFSVCNEFVKKEGNKPLKEMLKLEKVAFEGKRDRLVSYISKALAKFNADGEKNGGRFNVIESGISDGEREIHDFIAQAASRGVKIHSM